MNNSFYNLVKEHQYKYFLKTSDCYDEDDQITSNMFIDNRHKYVKKVYNMLCDIDSSLEICKSSINQIEILPNNDWLNKVGLTSDKFVVYTYSSFTSLLYTIIDQLLLLVNIVNSSKLDDKNVSYKTIQKNINEEYSELKQALRTIYINTNEIAQNRHNFIHHGQLRESPKIQTFRAMKAIFRIFKVPSKNVSDLYQEASEELLKQMNKEYEMLKQNVSTIENMLIALYEKKLQTIDGIDLPTEEYINTKNEALDYLEELHKNDQQES